jgi:mRNA interferase RelE/StbE
MKYSISWTEPAKKNLGKLSKPIAQRIFDKVKSLEDDPYRTAEHCEGYPWYHQRVGGYRVILKIDDAELIVSVLKVGPRKKVYDR